jgi:hypothetical protein
MVKVFWKSVVFLNSKQNQMADSLDSKAKNKKKTI